MTTYIFDKLTQENALIIANDWHYPGEYAFYDMSADPEDYEEIIDPKQRGDQYFQAVDEDQVLIGFFAICQTADEDTVEIGLGLAPTVAGHGHGSSFVRQILAYVAMYIPVRKVLLDVAEFNVRAQKVYAKEGFKISRHHDQLTNGSVYPFVTLLKTIR